MILRAALSLLVVGTASLIACSSASPYASCNAIIDACHPVDPGTGEIHECHEQAEAAKSDDVCAARKTACLALCGGPAADAGAPTDASRADGGDASK